MQDAILYRRFVLVVVLIAAMAATTANLIIETRSRQPSTGLTNCASRDICAALTKRAPR